MRTFLLPTEEESASSLPITLNHDRDFGLNGRGELEYDYNFLVYGWKIAGQEIFARSYLDDVQAVSIMMPLAEFDKPEYLPVLLYLQRRYRVIKTFEGAGYGVFWRLKT